ncbi:hypothetical protein [Halorussus sp. AFM4]|uniref:hypothetical protein n=1 Tax=Halorussus sp. AFM4 TaxID=3421651 RepID=UPI003EBC2BFC
MERRLFLGITLITIGASQALFFLTGVIPIATNYLATWIIAGINGGVLVGIGTELIRENLRLENGAEFGLAVSVALVVNVIGLALSFVA